MIAITPEPAIGMSRNTDRHGPESPHTDAVNAVAWSHDGKRLVTAGADGTIRIWAKRPFSALYQADIAFQACQRRCWSVAWSPDDSEVVSVGDDAAMKVWSAVEGLGNVELSGTPRRLGWDSHLLVDGWPLSDAELASVAIQRSFRPLTESECEKYLHTTSCPFLALAAPGKSKSARRGSGVDIQPPTPDRRLVYQGTLKGARGIRSTNDIEVREEGTGKVMLILKPHWSGSTDTLAGTLFASELRIAISKPGNDTPVREIVFQASSFKPDSANTLSTEIDEFEIRAETRVTKMAMIPTEKQGRIAAFEDDYSEVEIEVYKKTPR